MKLRSGIQLAFTAAEIDSIANSNASTPLLQLPQEVKNQIYEFVCGGRFLHIYQRNSRGVRKTVGLGNRLCVSWVTEEAAQRNFDNEALNKCTTFLRTCRQIHAEAKYIPYCTNTLSFDSPQNLRVFMTRLQQGQSQNHIAMRELHLKISPTSDADEIAWRKVLFLAAGRFKNLNRVYILLEHITSQERFGCKTPQQWETNLPGYQNRAMEAILGLKRLPIVHVTFTIDDHIMERTTNAYERSPFSRWTLEEKREWARYVKGKLLHDYP